MTHKRTENLEAETAPERHAVESVFVVALPEEIAYPIRREEFVTLREGERDSNDQRWRDVCIGISSTAFPALIGFIAEIDWKFAIASRKWMLFAFAVLFMAIFLSALTIACYLHAMVIQHKTDSAYSRLRQRIDDWFMSHG
jgi:hypothetical protein